MKASVLALLIRLKQKLFGTSSDRAKPNRPADPRIDQDPWLSPLFSQLDARYRLGNQTEHGLQILRRTGKERFNPMRTYLTPDSRGIACDYDVRIRNGRPLDDARALFDRRITAPLQTFGISQSSESVEEWGGQVITRRYRGTVDDPIKAAEAVRFLCEQSDSVMDMSAED